MPSQILPISISISTPSAHMQSIAAQPAVRNTRLSRQRTFLLKEILGMDGESSKETIAGCG